MKRGLRIMLGLCLMISSLGCIVEHRDDEYRRHREGFREHEDRDRDRYYRDGGEDRGRWERRDYDDPWR